MHKCSIVRSHVGICRKRDLRDKGIKKFRISFRFIFERVSNETAQKEVSYTTTYILTI